MSSAKTGPRTPGQTLRSSRSPAIHTCPSATASGSCGAAWPQRRDRALRPELDAAGRQRLQRLDLQAELVHQLVARDQVAEHRQARLVVRELAAVRALETSAAHPHAQLARLRHLVGREDDRSALARVRDLAAQGGPALGVALDRRVVGDRLDQLRDAAAEPRLQLAPLGVGVLEHVVQDAGGDHLVLVAGVLQQAGDLQRVRDEREAVEVARLPGVALIGKGKRVAGKRRPFHEIGPSHRGNGFEGVASQNVLYKSGRGTTGFSICRRRSSRAVHCTGLKTVSNSGVNPTWMWSAWSAIAKVAPPSSSSEMIWAGAIVPCSCIRRRTVCSVIPPASWWPRIGMPLTAAMSTAFPDEWCDTLPELVK